MKKSDVRSVIQADFQEKLDTGNYCIHHVFNGPNRKNSEAYGFLVAIRPALHDYVHANPDCEVWNAWRRLCQKWYEQYIGPRGEFIFEFGRSYL
ncbi:hypothetical protein ACTNEN_09700 [Oribacterium sp. HCP28S3_H8]|uniref:hypothetical protein n=1 Tax=Oribacterium sp. HCP28S3_H8 TaxID=3438945 RepID=UPI003F89E9E1